MKYFPLIVFVCLVGCKEQKEIRVPEKVAATPMACPSMSANQRLLIVPGKSIGNISLDMDAATLDSILGKPDLSDAAMGKAWLTWFSKVSDSVTGNELNIYTEYDNDEMTAKTVRQIRITSNEFATADGIRTGSRIDDITRLSRKLTLVGKYDMTTATPLQYLMR